MLTWQTDGIVRHVNHNGKVATVWPENGVFGFDVRDGTRHYSSHCPTLKEAISACESLLIRKDYILTFTGKKVDPLNPNPKVFDIIDMVHSLSMQCRFQGMTSKFYSVAHHSVLVSYICPIEFAPHAIVHDGSEYILKDIPTPVKSRIPEYREIEKEWQSMIYTYFGLDSIEPPEVKIADKVILATEFRDLMNYPEYAKENGLSCMEAKIIPWSQGESEYLMMSRMQELFQL